MKEIKENINVHAHGQEDSILLRFQVFSTLLIDPMKFQ